MKKLERLCCVLMMFLTLIGCSSSTPQTHDVIFQDSIRIDLGDDDVNTAEYVKRIDSYPISGSSIDGNKIHVSNITMVCPSLKKGDLEKLGKQELIYTIGDEKYTIEANIVDSVKPVINVKDNSLTFEVGEMKGINNYYSVSDNYDASKDIKVKVKNIDKLNKNKTGTYKLVIKAWDTSGNTASKKLTVIIKDTKKNRKKNKKKRKEKKRKKRKKQRKKKSKEKRKGNSNNSKVSRLRHLLRIQITVYQIHLQHLILPPRLNSQVAVHLLQGIICFHRGMICHQPQVPVNPH